MKIHITTKVGFGQTKVQRIAQPPPPVPPKIQGRKKRRSFRR